MNAVTHYIDSYRPTLNILQMFVKLQSKDTPSGNEENVTLFIVISCIGKDTIH